MCLFFFVFKQKTAYEMRISDWSSDVCSSDLIEIGRCDGIADQAIEPRLRFPAGKADRRDIAVGNIVLVDIQQVDIGPRRGVDADAERGREAEALILDMIAARKIGRAHV